MSHQWIIHLRAKLKAFNIIFLAHKNRIDMICPLNKSHKFIITQTLTLSWYILHKKINLIGIKDFQICLFKDQDY